MTSCSDDTTDNGNENINIDLQVQNLSSDLFGSAWKHVKTSRYNNDGELTKTNPSTGLTLYFSDKMHNTATHNDHQVYTGTLNGYDNVQWCIDQKGFYCYYSFALNKMNISASERGQITAIMPLFLDDTSIYRLTTSEMIVKCTYPNTHDYVLVYFSKTSNPSGEGNEGDTSETEKPEIWLEDYTEYPASGKLRVVYRYSSEEKVTSAKIYYGTSSNPTTSRTATISGTTVTYTISGLKNNTTYYFYATATSAAGTGISETTKYYYHKD